MIIGSQGLGIIYTEREIMKKPIVKASIAAFGLALLCNASSHSQQHHAPALSRSEAVFLWASQDGFNIAGENGSTFYYNGAKVYASSSSSGAPVFPQYPATNRVEIAEATAQLLSMGYQIKVSDNGLQVIATKP